MKKPIPEIQSEIANIIGNVAMISVNQGESLDRDCKYNAISLLKEIHDDLEEYKSKREEKNNE